MPKKSAGRISPMEIDSAEAARGHDCLALCNSFAEITATNTALAMVYLQDRDWNLERAVSDFLAERGTDEGKFNVTYIDLTESDATAETVPCDRPPVSETVLNVLSWNIDGLDRSNTVERVRAIVSCLTSEPFHAVCFQEVTCETLRLLKTALTDQYHILSPTDDPSADCIHYFVTILVRRHPGINVDRESFHVHPFPNSTMGRHLVSVDLLLDPSKFNHNSQSVSSVSQTIRLRLLTSHLESCREGAVERKAQLRYAWNCMAQSRSSTSQCATVDKALPQASIFCGDLNLRDKEVQDLGGVPPNIVDVWLATGSQPELCTTWDPRRNTNASRFGPVRQRSTFRYDRMYASGPLLRPIDFGLRGLEKVAGAACFPSDHWGILGRFQLNAGVDPAD